MQQRTPIGVPFWENPFVKLGLYSPEREHREAVNNYIPLQDFCLLPQPLEDNLAFGKYYLSLIHKAKVPMCEVIAWTHMTGERICGIFQGIAPAPNVEQLAVAKILLELSEDEFHQMVSLAIPSWLACGLNPHEQIEPAHTIFNKSDRKMKAVPGKTKKTAGVPSSIRIHKASEEGPTREQKHSKYLASVTQISDYAPFITHDVEQKPSHNGMTERPKAKVTPPNLRMKVKVDAVSFEDNTMIQAVHAGIGDCIRIDEVQCIERNMDDVVHYGCRSGKHKIDLFMDHGTWYMDASKLASGI